MMRGLPWRSGLPILVLAATLTAVLLPAYCDVIYDCGCEHWWNGLADACNIHTPGVPHCPWCSVGLSGFVAVYFAIVIPQAFVSFLPLAWGWPARLIAALATFPAAGLGVGLLMGWWMDYWRS